MAVESPERAVQRGAEPQSQGFNQVPAARPVATVAYAALWRSGIPSSGKSLHHPSRSGKNSGLSGPACFCRADSQENGLGQQSRPASASRQCGSAAFGAVGRQQRQGILVPVVNELYGSKLIHGDRRGELIHARCPHMDNGPCNGGGNRDMARWPASEQPLAPFFDKSAGLAGEGFLPCGVCSVSTARTWAICPNRLLSLKSGNPSSQQRPLFEKVLRLGGFKPGDLVRVWSEVSLIDKKQNLNYRFDYVLRSGSGPPIVVEVMTASTSGGNRSERTDIRNAFCDAVLFAVGTIPERRQSPGVNIRQVWARMASQLVVKSQIVNRWGGATIWVVQDALTDYIASSTGIPLDDLKSPDWSLGEVNVLACDMDDPTKLQLCAGPVYGSESEACWAQLLDTPSLPEFDVILDKLRPDTVTAEFTVA